MPWPRRAVALGALAGIWLSLAVAAGQILAGRTVDDVFITFRYAQNLAGHHGFVFNPGERVFGVTEPAVGLILGACAWLSGIAIPLLGTLFTAATLLALAGGLSLEASRRDRAIEGVVCGTLLLTTPLFWATQGAAAPAVLTLLLLGSRLAPRHGIAAGVVCGVAVAFRPDALVGCAILAGLLLLDTRRVPWRFGLAAAGVVALLALAAQGWFGEIVPQTLLAKQLHAARNPGSWIGLRSFWRAAFEPVGPGLSGSIVPWCLFPGLAGAVLYLRRGSLGERVIVLDGLLLIVLYPLLRVPFFSWYAIPPMVAALWGWSQLLGAAARALGEPHRVRRAVAAGLAAVLACLVLAWFDAFAVFLRDAQREDWRTIAYLEAGDWLRTHTPPDASVAFHEIGMLAFSSERHVDDLLGLVTPRSLSYAQEGDVVGAFLARPADYFIAHSFGDTGLMTAITTRRWFKSGYRAVAHFEHPEVGGWLTIFERLPGATLPERRGPRALTVLPWSADRLNDRTSRGS